MERQEVHYVSLTCLCLTCLDGKATCAASQPFHEVYEMLRLRLVVTLYPLISLALKLLSCPQSLIARTQYHILSHLLGLKILIEIFTGSFS